MLKVTPEDLAPYGFYPRAEVDRDKITEHRDHQDFGWQEAVSPIVHSEAEVVAAFPSRPAGRAWWVWGTQKQQPLPAKAQLPAETEPQWWPLSHFYWRCHATARASYDLTVSMGEWEQIFTAAEITAVVSTSEMVVALDPGHRLVSGTYGVTWQPTSFRYERRAMTCVVDGDTATFSGGSGSSIGGFSVGSTLTITHYDASEAETTHCLKQGMQLRAWQAMPEVDQPQYLASPSQTASVEAIAAEEVELSNVRFSTTWNAGTRPAGNTSTTVFYGDLVYLRCLDPPEHEGTLTTRDADGRGGVYTFPDGHLFSVGDYCSYQSSGLPAVEVTATTETTVTVDGGDSPGVSLPSTGTRSLYYLAHAWSGVRGTIERLYRVPRPTGTGTAGAFTTGPHQQWHALLAESFTVQVDMDHAGGYMVVFQLPVDQEYDDSTSPATEPYLHPLDRGEACRIWFGDAGYVEYYRLTEAESQALDDTYDPTGALVLALEWSAAIYGADGTLRSRRYYSQHPGWAGWSNPGRFHLLVLPAIHGDGYLVSTFPVRLIFSVDDLMTRADSAAYFPGTPPSSLTLSLYPQRSFRLAGCRNAYQDAVGVHSCRLYRSQLDAPAVYTSLDGDTMSLTAPAWFTLPPGGANVFLRITDASDAIVWQNTCTMLPIHRAGRGTLTVRTSATEGTVTIDAGNLEDGSQTRNLWWGTGLAASGREGVSCSLSGATLTFSGGTGDDLPEIDTEIHVLETPPADWTAVQGGSMQVLAPSTPPAPDPANTVTLLDSDHRQLRARPTYEFAYPYAFRVVVANHIDTGSNATYTLTWQVSEALNARIGAGWFYQYIERDEADAITLLVRAYVKLSNDQEDFVLSIDFWRDGMYDSLTACDYTSAITLGNAHVLTAEVTVADPDFYVLTSNGSLEGQVLGASDMIEVNSRKTGTLQTEWGWYNAAVTYTRANDTTGTLHAPPDCECGLYPPVGSEVSVAWHCHDGVDPYQIQATVEFTNDAGAFTVLSFGEGAALPPEGEVNSISVQLFYNAPADYMPNLTFTLTAIDAEP